MRLRARITLCGGILLRTRDVDSCQCFLGWARLSSSARLATTRSCQSRLLLRFCLEDLHHGPGEQTLKQTSQIKTSCNTCLLHAASWQQTDNTRSTLLLVMQLRFPALPTSLVCLHLNLLQLPCLAKTSAVQLLAPVVSHLLQCSQAFL